MLRITDISELVKRMKPGECSIRRMAGAYVDSEKEIRCYINQNFLSLEENVFYKYMGIVKNVFGKKIGDNMLSVEIEDHRMAENLDYAIAMDLKEQECIDRVIDRIIEHYYYVGRYLILLFTDVYDIPRCGKDGADQDESEEVYQHIICAICPVSRTAAGLGYDEENNTFGNRKMDWVVGKPSCGFIYPAFEERTVEADKMLFYTSDSEEPQHAFMENALGLKETQTITEICGRFKHLICSAMGGKEEGERVLPLICEQIYLRTLDLEDLILVSDKELDFACMAAGLGEEPAKEIIREYRLEFNKNYPKAAYLLNKPMLKQIEELRKKRELSEKCEDAAREIERLSGNRELALELLQIAARK